MPTIIHKRVTACQRGEDPKQIARLPSGWVVLGDHQVVHGYCLLLPDPVVPNLNALDLATRTGFLRDMSLLGDAILQVTGAARINYEILGNLDPALHAHTFPRYLDEPEELRTRPIWFYDFTKAKPFDFDQSASLMLNIAKSLFSIANANGLEIQIAPSLKGR